MPLLFYVHYSGRLLVRSLPVASPVMWCDGHLFVFIIICFSAALFCRPSRTFHVLSFIHSFIHWLHGNNFGIFIFSLHLFFKLERPLFGYHGMSKRTDDSFSPLNQYFSCFFLSVNDTTTIYLLKPETLSLPFSWRLRLVAQLVKNLPAMQKTWVWCLGWEDPLEKEMATHTSTLAWRIPWTEEPSGL